VSITARFALELGLVNRVMRAVVLGIEPLTDATLAVSSLSHGGNERSSSRLVFPLER
jgi:hypothetical protein